MITREVQRTIDSQARVLKPFVAIAVGTKRFQEMKQAAAAKSAERVPETIRRPAFRQDEGKLIAVGAVIGGLVDELQALVVLR